MTKAIIDTGTPRSVAGYMVSGALASAVTAGSINYARYKKEEMSSEQAVNNSLKLTAQGGIAAGSAIAAANYLGQNNILGFLTAVSVGVMGVYGVEQVARKFGDQKAVEETAAEEEAAEEA